MDFFIARCRSFVSSPLAWIAPILWRSLRLFLLLVGIVVTIGVAAMLYWSSLVAGYVSDAMLSNARAPGSDELSPTAYAISYSSADVQLLGGQGEELGCSISGKIASRAFPRRGTLAPISLRMRQACVFHDYCYRHGAATYGYTQADCDYMLLEHAYRICRFINTEATVSRCVSDARKVLLGVRIGGSENFKRADRIPFGLGGAKPGCHDNAAKRRILVSKELEEDLVDDCSSSYFEFNPYPVRASSYVVYRIADAPSDWVKANLHRKALYKFEIRPSGTRVTVLGWTRGEPKDTRCTGYELPAQFEYLNTAPQVVQSAAVGGETEDWFVWWRRFDLDQTGGYLAILAPRRSGLADWVALFPGATLRTPGDCNNSPVVSAGLNGLAPPSASFRIGTKTPDDAQFSELHATPGIEPRNGLRFAALRPHSCEPKVKSADTNNQAKTITAYPLCYLDILLDPSGSPIQRPVPYVVRDDINRLLDARTNPAVARDPSNDGNDPDRYRNFVTSPFALRGPENPAEPGAATLMLAWLRRGEDTGGGYDKTALLRRAYHVGPIGRAVAPLRLLDFPEAADPIFVIGRGEEPKLASIQARDGAVLIYAWRLPKPADRKSEINSKCFEIKDKLRVSLAACAEDVARQPLAESCAKALDDTWLMRRPVALPTAAGANQVAIVFTRVRFASKGDNRTISLDVISATIGGPDDQQCKLAAARTYPLNIDLPVKPPSGIGVADPAKENQRQRALRSANAAWEKNTGQALVDMRRRPVLVADLDENERYLILPNDRELSRSLIVPLSSKPDGT